MRSLIKPAVIALFIFGSFYAVARLGNSDRPQRDHVPQDQPGPKKAITSSSSKIQAAVLLDVSNSMDGLIDQAKAQLWNMVSVMGKATCDGTPPVIEIALYEY